jgi:hypothetical protein
MPAVVLAQEMMLHIIQFCDVPTLKYFRSVNRKMRDLIDTHQHSICSEITLRSLDAGEVAAFRPLYNPPSSPLRGLFATEHRIQISRWLSAVALENHRGDADMSQGRIFGNIGANEPQGDRVRDHVFIGWSILWRLSDIAVSVLGEELACNAVKSKGLSSLTRGLAIGRIRSLEESIRDRQLTYISTLSNHEAWCYDIMHRCVAVVFADRVFDDPRGKVSGWRTGNEYSRRNSWLNWLILREGPSYFAKAWSTKAGNEECSNYIIREWSGRSKEQFCFECAAAKEVEESLLEVSYAPNNTFRRLELMDLAKEGRLIQRAYGDVHFYLGRRLPQDVIRCIEEDYSDYSS